LLGEGVAAVGGALGLNLEGWGWRLGGAAVMARSGLAEWILGGVMGGNVADGVATVEIDGAGAGGVAISPLEGLDGGAEVAANMGPVPASSQGSDISGKAPIIFWTTSRLGLLRSLRIWLITGRPTPIRSANWVGLS
jgi:hypothetical protein